MTESNEGVHLNANPTGQTGVQEGGGGSRKLRAKRPWIGCTTARP